VLLFSLCAERRCLHAIAVGTQFVYRCPIAIFAQLWRSAEEVLCLAGDIQPAAYLSIWLYISNASPGLFINPYSFVTATKLRPSTSTQNFDLKLIHGQHCSSRKHSLQWPTTVCVRCCCVHDVMSRWYTVIRSAGLWSTCMRHAVVVTAGFLAGSTFPMI